MDFMQELKGKVEKTVNLVAKKAVEVKEISKIKYNVYDLNADVKKLYSEIGRSVYEQLRESATLPEDIRLKCEIVEAKLAKIAALRAKEGKIRSDEGELLCPVCGEPCDIDLDVCPVCGAELVQAVEADLGDRQ